MFHIGKWPYGATNIEISGITVNEHGGHAMGMFNGRGIHFHHARVKGMLFTQQVEDVRIEDCDIGGSETTGFSLRTHKLSCEEISSMTMIMGSVSRASPPCGWNEMSSRGACSRR